MTGAGINLRRRQALRVGTGLTVGFVANLVSKPAVAAFLSPHPQAGDAAAAAADGAPAFAPNAFIRIGSDGVIRLVMPMVEMGQGIYTGSCMLLAEELGVGLDQIQVQHAPPSDNLYGMKLLKGQITGGSTSTRATYTELREAGAVARTRLIRAAAARWRVDPASCTTERAQVLHRASGRSLSFGALADAAGRLPDPGPVTLKSIADFTLIGQPLERTDSADKVSGKTQFGIDVRLPGMKVATVKACPTLGGRLLSVNDAAARRVPGVIDVLRIDDAVAVVAEHFWAAKTGLQALDLQWDKGPNAQLTTRQLYQGLAQAQAKGRGVVGKSRGKKPSGTLVSEAYRMPMLAHATMEPLNATVHVHDGRCDIWAGIQVPVRACEGAAKILGLPIEKVTLHNQYLGGGFGRRLEFDYTDQAVRFARQVPYPLKVVWTREEDIKHDIVRPPYHDVISAVVDPEGWPVWFGDRICSPTVLGRWRPSALRADGWDRDAGESAVELPYDIENVQVEWVRHDMPKGLVVGFWRGVGALHNIFIVESFFDELAHRARKDPVVYRRSLLKNNPRTAALLDRAAARIGWGTQLPPRVGRGVAVADPFGSHVCAIVEVEVTPVGEVRLRKAVVAVDCGVAVNLSSIEAQIQGGLLFGLSAALYNEITLKGGEIEQSNFNDYRVLRLDEAPTIDVDIVKSSEAPGGVGELATAIAAPALANAIFAATGVRLRQLPIDRASLVADKSLLNTVSGSASIDRSRT